MYDIQGLKQLLDGFAGIPLSAWSHDEGIIPLDVDGKFPSEGFCVGHKVCDVMQIPAEYSEFVNCLIVNYENGVEKLRYMLLVSSAELEQLLYNQGAPREPFGEKVWDIDPFIVLMKVIKQKTGFDYGAEYVPTELLPEVTV